MKELRVLMVGQTPPPFGGQAIMIENILRGSYEHTRLFHVRLQFSREMDEVGSFQFRKIMHLMAVLWRIVITRIIHRANVLYYPPAGPETIPVIRDIIILIMIRWMFGKTIFHFHASGISEYYGHLRGLSKALFEKAFFFPDITIRLSQYSPPDGEILKAHLDVIVPYGIPDVDAGTSVPLESRVPRLLFVGVVRESKGVIDLLEACELLLRKGRRFTVDILGKVESPEIGKTIDGILDRDGLRSVVHLKGVVVGEEKHHHFSQASLFCFPTFFESEAFPVVLLEAMRHGLPIVSTKWRGIPSIVSNGVNGYLVPIRDVAALAQKVDLLMSHPTIRKRMGQKGREMFIEKFTLDKFHGNMGRVFNAAGIPA